MLHTKMMLAKSQPHFVLDSNQTLKLLHNVILKYQFTTVTNSIIFLQNKKNNIIKEIGSSPQDKPVYGATYLNPLIIIPKRDYQMYIRR